ncbi:hypothetical protein BJX70DRAFT_403939 [Aspergillus crustosus]
MCEASKVLIALKKKTEAEKRFFEAHQRVTTTFGPNDVRVLSACVDICWDHHLRNHLNPLEGLVIFVFDNYTGQAGLKNERTAVIFDIFGKIYDVRGNLIGGERYSIRAYEIYVDISDIGHVDAIVTGLRVDRLRRELGQVMERLKNEQRLETREETLIGESEAAILHGINLEGTGNPKLVRSHVRLYKKRFDDTGRWSYLDTAVKWLETAIELLEGDASSRGEWLEELSVYRLQTCSRL